MSDELKPCPFCGSDHTSIEIESSELGRIARVHCEICGATQSGMGVMVGPDDDATLSASACAAWNRRAPAPLPDNVRAAVESVQAWLDLQCEGDQQADLPWGLRTILDHLQEKP